MVSAKVFFRNSAGRLLGFALALTALSCPSPALVAQEEDFELDKDLGEADRGFEKPPDVKLQLSTDSSHFSSTKEVEFGQICLGGESSLVVKIRNRGSQAASVTVERSPESDEDFELLDGFLPDPLPPTFELGAGGKRSILVRFAPQAEGERQASFTFSAGESEVVVTAVGTGVKLLVQPGALDFGAVLIGLTAERRIRLFNCTNTTIPISEHIFHRNMAGLFEVELPNEIPPGQSAAGTVSFTPATTEKSDAILFIDQGDGGGILTEAQLPLSGSGSVVDPSDTVLVVNTIFRNPPTGCEDSSCPVVLRGRTGQPFIVDLDLSLESEQPVEGWTFSIQVADPLPAPPEDGGPTNGEGDPGSSKVLKVEKGEAAESGQGVGGAGPTDPSRNDGQQGAQGAANPEAPAPPGEIEIGKIRLEVIPGDVPAAFPVHFVPQDTAGGRVDNVVMIDGESVTPAFQNLEFQVIPEEPLGEYRERLESEGGTNFVDHAFRLEQTDEPLCWTDAKDAAETTNFAGLQGHLPTVTSSQKNDVLVQILAGQVAPSPFDLGDATAGGNGRGTAPPENIGIDPRSGEFVTVPFHNVLYPAPGLALEAVPVDSPYVDSVFIIGQWVFDENGRVVPSPGGPPVEQAVTQSGLIYEFPSEDGYGSIFNHILRDSNGGVQGPPIEVGNVEVETAVGVHASAGITYDLREIRAEFDETVSLRFRTFWGTDGCAIGDMTLYAIVLSEGGEILAQRSFHATAGTGEAVDLPLPPEGAYLVLATGSRGVDFCDHGTFGDARIEPEVPHQIWLGGEQGPSDDPAENWRWATGEPFDYTNWAAGEPNDFLGTEESYLGMWTGTLGRPPGTWNDNTECSHLQGNILAVEYTGESAEISLMACLGEASEEPSCGCGDPLVLTDEVPEPELTGSIRIEDPAGLGVRGWSLSLAVDGAAVGGASVDGTDVPTEVIFQSTEVIDPDRNGGQEGVVSAVVLSFGDTASLPPEATVLSIQLEPVLPPLGEATAVTVQFVDGLAGSGAPVSNGVTLSDLGTVRPFFDDCVREVFLGGSRDPEFAYVDVNSDGLFTPGLDQGPAEGVHVVGDLEDQGVFVAPPGTGIVFPASVGPRNFGGPVTIEADGVLRVGAGVRLTADQIVLEAGHLLLHSLSRLQAGGGISVESRGSVLAGQHVSLKAQESIRLVAEEGGTQLGAHGRLEAPEVEMSSLTSVLLGEQLWIRAEELKVLAPLGALAGDEIHVHADRIDVRAAGVSVTSSHLHGDPEISFETELLNLEGTVIGEDPEDP